MASIRYDIMVDIICPECDSECTEVGYALGLGYTKYYMQCLNCFEKGPSSHVESDAISAWIDVKRKRREYNVFIEHNVDQYNQDQFTPLHKDKAEELFVMCLDLSMAKELLHKCLKIMQYYFNRPEDSKTIDDVERFLKGKYEHYS